MCGCTREGFGKLRAQPENERLSDICFTGRPLANADAGAWQMMEGYMGLPDTGIGNAPAADVVHIKEHAQPLASPKLVATRVLRVLQGRSSNQVLEMPCRVAEIQTCTVIIHPGPSCR